MPIFIAFVRVRIVAYISLAPKCCIYHKGLYMLLYIAFVRVAIVAYITREHVNARCASY